MASIVLTFKSNYAVFNLLLLETGFHYGNAYRKNPFAGSIAVSS